MRNDLIFQQNRQHILQVIHGALRDCQQWREALQLANQYTQLDWEMISKDTTIQEVLPSSASMYCFVDISWVNEKEVGGIGWVLYSKEGVHKLHASSSIKPTNSPFEAEACSLLMAVQEVWKLRYKHVVFMTDCKQLRDELHQQMTEQTIFKVRNTEASSLIRDIVAMAKQFSFTFHYVPRALTRNVDVMAKEATQEQRNYVISWKF
ncbi:hypothetical protein F2Q68_00002559 [Brassica cretica]|uniref:RNase H type-1 domain-containing protein n=1 Tax=Brassica cretica TaxID=69181 RepID=A0A8S9JIV8_BRACR|nr:hypothetical protein F2Q68_00002559 [Brassica cretica]